MQLQFGFDYEILNIENRLIVKQRTQELKERLQRTAQDIWEIGQKLADVRSRLKHGQFESWLEAEFGWSRRTAYNFISVYETFQEHAKFAQISIDPSALYLLASRSTPQAIRDKFIQKAKSGNKVTHKDIREAVSQQKLKSPPSTTPDQTTKLAAPSVVNADIALTDLEVKYTVTEIQKTPTPAAYPQLKPSTTQAYWYLLEKQHLLFYGDPNSQQFIERLPFAALALGVSAGEWYYSWLTKKAKATIILEQQKILDEQLVAQLIRMFTKRGEAVILPWLPSGEIIAVVHELGRSLYTGDPNSERCRQAIATSQLKAERINLL